MDDNLQKIWIIEFLLKQQIDDHLLNRLISALSPSIESPSLMKSLLLRMVSSEIQKSLTSEKILESFEHIEEQNYLKSSRILDSMKEACSAVVEDCTVKFLKENHDDNGIYKMFKGRKEVDSVSDWSNYFKGVLEAAFRNVRARGDFPLMVTRVDAHKLVQMFVEELTDVIGPSSVELAAKRMCENGEVGVGQGSSLHDNLDGNGPEKTLIDKNAYSSSYGQVVKKEFDKAQGVQVPINYVVDDRIGARQKCSLEALDENLDKNDVNFSGDRSSKMDADIPVGAPCTTTRKCNPLQTPKFEEVHEGLSSSLVDPHVFVEIPISTDMEKEGVGNVQLAENQNEVDMERCDNSHEKVHVVQFGKHYTRKPIVVSKSSLMERNSTAHTYEWGGDKIESSSQGSSKMRTHVTLGRQKSKNIAGKRKKKWSVLEEETLIDAVKEYGKGNWRCILDNCKEIFIGRTPVDLKDKWRNLIS